MLVLNPIGYHELLRQNMGACLMLPGNDVEKIRAEYQKTYRAS